MERPPSRVAPYVALAILGFGLVLAVRIPDPGPRLSSRDRIVDLIANEDLRARLLRDELRRLEARLDAMSAEAALQAGALQDVRAQIERLGRLAGLAEVEGPGVTVELRDSSLREAPSGDPNDLVIHEQDLQAVVNALWAAGAEAVAINGERITSASAVRCVGNTLLLHGAVYAPPYRIQAIGEPAALVDGLARDALVERFRVFAEEFRLGFDVTPVPAMRVAAFRGTAVRG